jgi:putative membrane protein
MLGVWTLLALAVLLCASAFFARRSVAALGWVAVDGAVLFRSGWLWRSTSVTRFSRIQTVRLAESPFDRRTGMARVKVDTAGAAHAAHGIDIPYLPLETARSLSGTLVAHAARTTFKW